MNSSDPRRPQAHGSTAKASPLVLLDLDGVVNDLGSIYGRRRPWGIDVVRSHGFDVHIPDFMPELIQRLAGTAEIRWLTTWRERANDVVDHLGVNPFPVIDDGTRDGFPFWKPKAAFDLAQTALSEGRQVLWIEDFRGYFPASQMPAGVVFVDTVVFDIHDAALDPDMVGAVMPEVVAGWSYNRIPTIPLAEQRRRLILGEATETSRYEL